MRGDNGLIDGVVGAMVGALMGAGVQGFSARRARRNRLADEIDARLRSVESTLARLEGFIGKEHS